MQETNRAMTYQLFRFIIVVCCRSRSRFKNLSPTNLNRDIEHQEKVVVI